MSSSLRRSGLSSVKVDHMFLRPEGKKPLLNCWKNCSLKNKVSFGRGSMFKFLKIGSVWALYDEDDIILTAAFCFLIRQFMNSLSESFSFWQKQIQLRLKSDYCTITNNTLPVSISWRSRSYQSLSHGNSVLYVIIKNTLPFVKFQLKFEHQNFISSTEGQRAKAFLIFSNCCLTVTTTSGLYVEQDRDMNSPPFHQIAA